MDEFISTNGDPRLAAALRAIGTPGGTGPDLNLGSESFEGGEERNEVSGLDSSDTSVQESDLDLEDDNESYQVSINDLLLALNQAVETIDSIQMEKSLDELKKMAVSDQIVVCLNILDAKKDSWQDPSSKNKVLLGKIYNHGLNLLRSNHILKFSQELIATLASKPNIYPEYTERAILIINEPQKKQLVIRGFNTLSVLLRGNNTLLDEVTLIKKFDGVNSFVVKKIFDEQLLALDLKQIIPFYLAQITKAQPAFCILARDSIESRMTEITDLILVAKGNNDNQLLNQIQYLVNCPYFINISTFDNVRLSVQNAIISLSLES